jgi:hypothetical protein
VPQKLRWYQRWLQKKLSVYNNNKDRNIPPKPYCRATVKVIIPTVISFDGKGNIKYK